MRTEKETLIFRTIGYAFITLLSVLGLLPFLLVLSGSITSENSIYVDGYTLIPKSISFEAYKVLFKAPEQIFSSYFITIMLTVIGTTFGLFITSMTAYVLYRKDFKYRNKFAFYFYFTTLFSGGLTPFYIMIVKTLHMKDSFLAMLLPPLLSVWYILIMRNFMKSIPDSILESAKIDGVGDFMLFIRIVIPLAKPGLATIGLFIALNYWNDWYQAMLFIENSKLYPLQYFLYRMINSGDFADNVVAAAKVSSVSMPRESMKLAMTVVATGPIIFAYPFVQKYFVKGLTIGAVKG